MPEGYTGESATFVVTIDGVETEYTVLPGEIEHIERTLDEDSADVAISVEVKGGSEPETATIESDCDLNPVIVTLSTTPPTCLAAGTVDYEREPRNYRWVIDEKAGTFTAVANEGFYIPGVATFGPFDLARLTGRLCETPVNFKAVTVTCGAITFSNVGTPAAGQYGVDAVFVTTPVWIGGPVTVAFGESTIRSLPEDITDTDTIVQIDVDGNSYSVLTDCVKVAALPPAQAPVPPAQAPVPPTQPTPAPVPPTTTTVAPPSGTLPVTGGTPWMLVWIALAALGGGYMIVRVSRRSTT